MLTKNAEKSLDVMKNWPFFKIDLVLSKTKSQILIKYLLNSRLDLAQCSSKISLKRPKIFDKEFHIAILKG